MKRLGSLAIASLLASSIFSGVAYAENDTSIINNVYIDASSDNLIYNLHRNVTIGEILDLLSKYEEMLSGKTQLEMLNTFKQKSILGKSVFLSDNITVEDMVIIISGLSKADGDDSWEAADIYGMGIIATDLNNNMPVSKKLSKQEAASIVDRLYNDNQRINIINKMPRLFTYEQLSISNEGKSVFDVAQIDIGDQSISAMVAMADNAMGRTKELRTISESKSAIAGINGTYYNVYSQQSTNYGLLVMGGKVVNYNGKESLAFGFDDKGNMDITNVRADIELATNEDMDQPMTLANSYINYSCYHQENHNTIFTPEYGADNKIDNGRNVVVKNSIISDITDKPVTVPVDGFVYNYVGDGSMQNNISLNIGQSLDYNIALKPANGNDEFWSRAKGVVAGLHLLVDDGQIVTRSEFDKGVNAYKIPRSGMGYTADNQLVIVSSTEASLMDLAIALEELGCEKAMSVGLGLGSSMYYRGKDLQSDRKVTNALLIVEE